MTKKELTPLMQQYYELKEKSEGALLFFRMGDFYELFGDDAVIASRILEITLTSRDKNKEDALAMAGFPHHSITSYLQKLLKAGYKVAIGEQVEDPKNAKGIVKREIVRTFSPALNFDQMDTEFSYLCSILLEENKKTWTLCLIEPSTGEVLSLSGLTEAELQTEIHSTQIKHILYLENKITESLKKTIKGFQNKLIESLPEHYLSQDRASKLIQAHYDMRDFSSILNSQSSLLCLGLALQYVLKSQNISLLGHLKLPKPLHSAQCIELAPQTITHLNIFDTEDNLFDLINTTKSSLGSRKLKSWLQRPLNQLNQIQTRQDAVKELSLERHHAKSLSSDFAQCYDIERILGRISTGLANPRDTLCLAQSLNITSSLLEKLSLSRSVLLKNITSDLSKAWTQIQPLCEKILRIQKEDAPLSSKDGGLFNKGFSSELDTLIDLNENGQNWLLSLEKKEKEATGIPSLKVRFNRVFGYYIEVTKTHLKNVPERYQRKQSMATAERFFTEELKKFEDEILSASQKQKSLELNLFQDLIDELKQATLAMSEIAENIAQADALVALSQLAHLTSWSFPEIHEGLDLNIQAGRHPLVDENLHGEFVPNDAQLSPQTQMTLMITGPNMGGKSTYMRQIALMILLGQIGAPIPAKKASWGVVSQLFTRIGAHDAISQGQSTFMVEMTELAHILHHADERSLIILDEIGRGTSTYDGMSVAWATLEWMSSKIKARTFFATHYHELTSLEKELPLLANAHMGVEEKSGELRFLYKIIQGPSLHSFGIQVASLAGIPKPVIQRSWQVLKTLENQEAQIQSPVISTHQMSLFDTNQVQPEPTLSPQEITTLESLKNINPNEMTPIQALKFLADTKERFDESSSSTA